MIEGLSPAASAFLRRVAMKGLIEAAAAISKLDERLNPDSYPKAHADLCAAIEASHAVQFDAPPSRPGLPAHGTGHAHDELEAMRAGGLEPGKEFGPFHPQASTPSCVHGRRFTEPCQLCEERQPLDVPGPVVVDANDADSNTGLAG